VLGAAFMRPLRNEPASPHVAIDIATHDLLSHNQVPILLSVPRRDLTRYGVSKSPVQLHVGADLNPVHIIGGGLAGSEAAWQLSRAGVPPPAPKTG
jgi:glucose inhibited division protein A